MNHNIDDLKPKIRWVSDALIPSDPKSGMPSATEAGMIEKLLPIALKERDDLAPSFFAALSGLPDVRPNEPMKVLRAINPDDFQLISFLIAGAYFLDADVNQRLRYPGQEAVLENPDFDEIIDIAERVQARGHVYLEVPDKA